ncbi:hypothetical protein [Streptomyces sp. ME19-01-6]|uniref:hypothetical protein n=1 Tax=Streptomyces sp. ME19-01-6 TaxID=3028686 RepID=UPI0029A00D1B|nr:hypothetical protein [Streptomyces sp. ME19-01-6]MDX3231259.1 hypothetical protein [Streptomyces sp. ME19-01-6]
MPLVTPAVAPFEYSLHIPHDPRAVRVARASLRTALTAHELPELIDRAELLASDLANSRSSLFSWRLRGAGSPGVQAAT